MVNAFDWIENTQQGKNVYQSKLNFVTQWVAGQRTNRPNLPDLTAAQKEDDALVFYGPYAVQLQHYYIPNANYNGWIVNPNCANGQGYVSAVRSRTVPN